MTVHLLNTHTDRVVAYAEPEDIAPPHKEYPNREAKAAAERAARRRKNLLDTLRSSRRWRVTDRPVTRETARQREQARQAAERRRIEAQVRAEYETKLETERAKFAGEAADAQQAHDAQPKEPTQAELRAWAKEAGYEVPSRGKIPEEVADAYRQAHAPDAENA